MYSQLSSAFLFDKDRWRILSLENVSKFMKFWRMPKILKTRGNRSLHDAAAIKYWMYSCLETFYTNMKPETPVWKSINWYVENET